MTTEEAVAQARGLLGGHPRADEVIELVEAIATERDNLRNVVNEALEHTRALAYDLGNA